jgi:lipid II:glycine glycyltransferase (peptidoglycan interpeptide bridge formation enzyme)
MHVGGETSYHHGASATAFKHIPASYLLQWQAICDALRRGDRIYNFWGIAPPHPPTEKHPFDGVSLFKTGFGGEIMNLQHCIDLPIKPTYWLTYAFEIFRRWRRGF